MQCCVPGCNTKVSDPCKPTFHRFPADTQRKQQWKQSLKISKITNMSAVCSKHFKKEDYQEENGKRIHLRENAEPIPISIDDESRNAKPPPAKRARREEIVHKKQQIENEAIANQSCKNSELKIQSDNPKESTVVVERISRNQIRITPQNHPSILVTHVCEPRSHKKHINTEPWEEFGKMSLRRAMESSSESDTEISDRIEIRRKKLNRLRQDLPELRKKVANLQKLNFKYKQRLQNLKGVVKNLKAQIPKASIKKPSRPPRPKGPQMSTVKNMVNEMIKQEAVKNAVNESVQLGGKSQEANQQTDDYIEVEYLEDDLVKEEYADDFFSDDYLDKEFLQ